MRALLKTGLIIFFIIFSMLARAEMSQNYWYQFTEDKQVKLRVDLFLSSTCPHCQKADTFFKEQQAKAPWLDIHRHMINQDKSALDTFHQEMQFFHDEDYAVPAIFFCKTHWAGFDTAQTTGVALLDALNYCHQQVQEKGYLTTESHQLLKQLSTASWLSGSLKNNPSLYSFLPLMVVVDLLSTCSFFCLLALFSFVSLHRDFKVKLELGIVFLFVLTLVHYFQQAHTEVFYQYFGWIRFLAILTGLALIGYSLIVFYKRSTNMKGIFVFILVGFTSFVLQAYQQSCTPNIGLFFHQWLKAQHVGSWQIELYSIVYLLIYLLPWIVILFLLSKLNQIKRLKPYWTLFICVAWCLLIMIGFVLVFSPFSLSSMKLSLFIPLIATVACFLMLKQKERLGLTWHE